MVVTGITLQAYGKVAARKVAVRWRLGRGTDQKDGSHEGVQGGETG